MQDINDVALEARFGDAQLDPTPTMIKRMEILKANRSKVLALNSDNGDPVFAHKATIFMHDYFRNRLRSTFSDETDLDLYLAFALAGHHNLIQYWLEARPDLEARTRCRRPQSHVLRTALCRRCIASLAPTYSRF